MMFGSLQVCAAISIAGFDLAMTLARFLRHIVSCNWVDEPLSFVVQ